MRAGKRNGEVLALLVSRGGKPSLNHPEWSRQSKGASPLHTAARLGQVANAEALLRLGADVGVVDASGQTALHVAAVHEITGQYASDVACGVGAEGGGLRGSIPPVLNPTFQAKLF